MGRAAVGLDRAALRCSFRGAGLEHRPDRGYRRAKLGKDIAETPIGH